MNVAARQFPGTSRFVQVAPAIHIFRPSESARRGRRPRHGRARVLPAVGQAILNCAEGGLVFAPRWVAFAFGLEVGAVAWHCQMLHADGKLRLIQRRGENWYAAPEPGKDAALPHRKERL